MTGLISYEDYEDILAYENSSLKESFSLEVEEDFIIKEEPSYFGISAIVYNDTCFVEASNIANPGNTIILTADIEETDGLNCIHINLENITLDCNGHSIKGMHNNSDNGIKITKNNITVKNCIIYNFTSLVPESNGILVQAGVGVTANFTNNLIYNVTNSGIRIKDEGNYSITNLTVHNANYGVYFQEVVAIKNANVNITKSYFYNNSDSGIRSEMFGGNFLIDDNTFLSETEKAIYLRGLNTGSKIANFTITNNKFNFISSGSISIGDLDATYVDNIVFANNNVSRTFRISDSGRINISSNIFEDNLPAGQTGKAIHVQSAENITITHNQIPKEVELSQNKNQTIYNNNLTGNARINVIAGSDANIFENTFTDVFVTEQTSGGILLDGTENSTVTKNNITNGIMYSIDLSGNNNNATNNIVENTIGYAFKINGNNNLIFNNTIKNHTGTGFWTQGINNTFFLNNITINLKMMNTSLNYDNVSGPYPQVEEAGDVFLLLNNSRTNITSNLITIFNPLNLRIGVYGIRTINYTNIGINIYSAETKNLTVFNNTFGTIAGIGLKTAIKLVESYEAKIHQNKFYSSEHESINIESGQKNNISNNEIIGIYNTVPYYSETGIKIFRTKNNIIEKNNITNYDFGIYCYNSSLNTYDLNNITISSRSGIFLFRCFNETFTENKIINASSGIKLFYSNYSEFDTNTINHTKTGFDLNQAHNNTFTSNTQENSVIGLSLGLFSLGNIFDLNTFEGTDVDILYNMFATNNSGALNTFVTTRTKNYATGNTIG
jgi:parallel beta-helix repeat protein